MPPHDNNPGGKPNSAHGVNSNSSSNSVFTQSNPHGSSPYVLTPAFAQTHHEPPPSAAINSLHKRHDSAHNTATPVCGNFSSPSITRTRTEGSFSGALPFASLPAAQTQSRLPPNTVAHKAPRKARAAPAQPVQGSPKLFKSKSKNTKLRHHSIISSCAPASPTTARKSPKDGPPRSKQSASTTPLPASSKKAIASECGNRAIDRSAPLSREAKLAEDDKNSSATLTESPPHGSEKNKEAHAIILRRHIHTSTQAQRPQPRFEYEITSELDSIERALGLDNWTEYLILVERYVFLEIPEREFEVQERRIFHVFDPKVRRKMKGMAVKRVMGPVVD